MSSIDSPEATLRAHAATCLVQLNVWLFASSPEGCIVLPAWGGSPD